MRAIFSGTFLPAHARPGPEEFIRHYSRVTGSVFDRISAEMPDREHMPCSPPVEVGTSQFVSDSGLSTTPHNVHRMLVLNAFPPEEGGLPPTSILSLHAISSIQPTELGGIISWAAD
jgi:hypothetical protein